MNPIQRYLPNAPFTWSLGWNFAVIVHGRTNAQGFVADYDYDANAAPPLVAVVGDSFVEALMVPFAETLTGRLQTMLGNGGRAYAFAQSGSPLSQYVAYVRHACDIYRPERVVVVVVGNDFDESLYAHRLRDGIHHLHPRSDGGFDRRLSPPARPGLAERMLRHSALALYLVRNVGALSLLRDFAPAPAKTDTALAPAKTDPALAPAKTTPLWRRQRRIPNGVAMSETHWPRQTANVLPKERGSLTGSWRRSRRRLVFPHAIS